MLDKLDYVIVPMLRVGMPPGTLCVPLGLKKQSLKLRANTVCVEETLKGANTPLVESSMKSQLKSAPKQTANHPLKHLITPRSPAAAMRRKSIDYASVKTGLICDKPPLLPKTDRHYMLRFEM
ncbi:hypothetical protein [Pseudomonas viridiflava]|uniref:hypothetical protein n=1 Tax=Pseudomonas viridiflava TaxID=33069 RepID=UPI000F0238BE|nr:hypothetical protein [Pseudomonas viridiflava]